MSLNQSLIKLAAVGILFLVIFGYLSTSNKKEIIQEINDCQGCYTRTKTIMQEQPLIIEGLLRQLQHKQYELKRLRKLSGQKMDCDGVNDLNAQNQKLVSRIYDLQKWQKHHNRDELVNELEKCRAAFETIMTRIDYVYN